MDASLTETQDAQSGFDRPPILVAGDSADALDRAVRTIEASGLRVAGKIGLNEAPERIDRQIAASALWIELEADSGAPMDRLLDHVNDDVANGRYRRSSPLRLSCSMRSPPDSPMGESSWWSTAVTPIERPRSRSP